MSIKQNGGVFGRNPTFNDVTIEGQLTFDGDIDINSDLKINGDLEVDGGATIDQDAVAVAFKVTGGNGGLNVAEFSRDIGADATVGINGNGGDPQIYFQAVGNTFAIGTNSTVFEIADNNAIGTNTRLSISNVGDVSVSTGNLVIGTSGKGIDFSATAGTGTSELLDDYEEGLFTPTLTTNGTDFDSVTYDANITGQYTKVGNVVNFDLWMRTDAITKGSASGTVRLGGLPFTGVSFGVVSVGNTYAWLGTAPTNGYVSGTIVELSSGANTFTTIADVDIGTNDNEIRLSGTYLTA